MKETYGTCWGCGGAGGWETVHSWVDEDGNEHEEVLWYTCSVCNGTGISDDRED